MSRVKYLITGRNGQLAREFIRTFERAGTPYLAPAESEFDITDPAAIDRTVSSFKPGVIINCAAYNLVDKAEEERDKAFLINATGPRFLAQAAKKHGARLVHFSSDYVFNGLKENGLYGEGDFPAPLNEYGRSKLEGERLVRQEAGEHLILRLSWVFGEGSQNFLYKLEEWAGKNEYLKIACDEFSVPTSTRTIVETTLRALERNVNGLYHLTNSGYCSRYEWARLALSVLGIRKFVRPVSMDSFNLPAKRPKFSAMTNEALSRVLDMQIPSWTDAVTAFLKERTQ